MPFPTESLLDSLKRAAEKPLSNASKWLLPSGCLTKGEISLEAYKLSSAFPTEDGAFWEAEEFSGEDAFSLEYRASMSAERFMRLWACQTFPAGGRSGYALKVLGEATPKVKLVLEKWTEGVPTTMVEKAGVVLTAGDTFGIFVAGGTVSAWHKVGAGAWEEVISHADATYTRGYVGMSGQGNAHTWRNAEAAGTPIKGMILTPTVQKQVVKLSKTPSRTLLPTAATEVVTLTASRNLIATQSQTPTLARALARNLTRQTVHETVTLKRARSKSHALAIVPVESSATLAVSAGFLKFNVQGSSIATISKRPERLLAVAVTQAVTLSRVIESSSEREAKEKREEEKRREEEPHTTAGEFASMGLVMS